eukprot:327067_1
MKLGKRCHHLLLWITIAISIPAIHGWSCALYLYRDFDQTGDRWGPFDVGIWRDFDNPQGGSFDNDQVSSATLHAAGYTCHAQFYWAGCFEYDADRTMLTWPHTTTKDSWNGIGLNDQLSCVYVSAVATPKPTPKPTSAPIPGPTAGPTPAPTLATHVPTAAPTSDPTNDPTTDPTMDPTSDPTNDPTTDPTHSPTDCVDYESPFIVYNSNDGNDTISDINIAPQIQKSFALSANETVVFYNDPPTDDAPVPYMNALIGCNVSTETVCNVTCIGPASCLLANVIPSSPFMERILIRCNQKFSCKSMTLNYSQSLSPNVNEISIECSASLACDESVVNVFSEIESTYYDANDTEVYVTIYCMDTLSCKGMTLNIRQFFAVAVYINVYCVSENSCKQFAILNEHNEDIHIQLWSFEYSESIHVKTTASGYDLVDIRCGNEDDARYFRYDTHDLLNDEELLRKARKEYTARRLPCEDIAITCTNTIDAQVYDQQCAMRYRLSDMVVTKILKKERDCFWINVNQLYTPQFDGSCGQTLTMYEYTMSVELEMTLGINPDDQNDLNDQDACDEYFGDVNVTAQTLTSIDAILNAALRFYVDTKQIHNIEKHSDSRVVNEPINCDGFNMENDVVLINSTFSVQSIIPNRDGVDVLFAPVSI